MQENAPTRHRVRCRSGQGGAAMIEALLVISFMVIGFLGLMFFYNFYLQQIHSMRIAQASVVAYSLGGCSQNVPSTWIGTDRGRLRMLDPRQVDRPANNTSPNGQTASSSDTGVQQVLGSMGGILPGGNGILNPIVTSRSSGRVTLERGRASVLSARGRPMFDTTVGASAHVTCGDLPHDGSVSEMLSTVWNTFKGLMGL